MPKRVTGPDGTVVEFPDDADEATIKRVMSEAYAAKQAGQTKPKTSQTAAESGIRRTPRKEDSGLTKFARGAAAVAAIPVDVATGDLETAGDKVGTFAEGAVKSLEAAGRGVMNIGGDADNLLIAGISEGIDAVTGNDTGTFKEKVQRDKAKAKQLRKDAPIGTFAGEVYGFGRAGQALRSGVKQTTGKTIGLGTEAAALAGIQTTLEGEGLDKAAQNAALAFVGGKAAEGIGDKVLAPGLKWITGKLDKRLKGGEISPAVITALANRTERPASEVATAVAEFTRVNKRSPSLAEISDQKTIDEFVELARARKPVAQVFRTAEEEAALSRPGEVQRAVEATGDTALGADEIASRQAAAAAAQKTVRTQTNEGTAAIADDARASQRMVRDESEKLVAEQEQLIEQTGEELRQSIINSTKVADDMASPDVIQSNIKAWADDVMRNPKTGLEKGKIEIPPKSIDKIIPAQSMRTVLQSMAKATPERTAKFKRINAALRAIDEGRPVKLTVGDVDSMRRAFSNMVDDAGVKFDLAKANAELSKLAEKQVPGYKNFLTQYRKLQEAAEGFNKGRGVLTDGPTSFNADVGAMSPFGKAGAATGALTRINDALGTSPKPLQDAAKLVARRDTLENTLGAQGKALADEAEAALERVTAITDEIAEIREAARNTREGLSDDARRQIRELRAAAGEEIANIREGLARNEAALKAAGNVLDESNVSLNAALNMADESLPTGAVARRSIADTAGQSPADALRTANRLRESGAASRVARVAGEETADTLRAVGETQTRAATNLNQLSVRSPQDPLVPVEVSAAIDIAATLTGRAGAGFAANAFQRVLRRSGRLALSDAEAMALSRAIVTRDPRVVNEIIDKLATSQRTRKQIEQAVDRAAVALAAGTMGSRE